MHRIEVLKSKIVYNLVSVVSSGEIQDSRPYLCMNFIQCNNGMKQRPIRFRKKN